jgi:hypothetical protein
VPPRRKACATPSPSPLVPPTQLVTLCRCSYGLFSPPVSLAPDADSKFRVPDKCKGKQVSFCIQRRLGCTGGQHGCNRCVARVFVVIEKRLQFIGGNVPVKANLGISYAGNSMLCECCMCPELKPNPLQATPT